MSDPRLDFAPHLDFASILTNPILDIAARVWEEERYAAFKVCYRSMRLIDDLVDQRKSSGQPLSETEVEQLSALIGRWLDSVRRKESDNEFHHAFVETLHKFRMPLWPWERLCRAMIFDLTHISFANLHVFLRYCEGAAISPAAIFMHLCGVKHPDSNYTLPPYDIRAAARPLAIFSYLVHIMRDFEKDQRSGLNYFADDIVASCGLTPAGLRELAREQRATPELRSLMRIYHRIAEAYRIRARVVVNRTIPLLEPRYQLSLELIYSLYTQIFERIDSEHGQFTAEALNPTPQQVEARIYLTINSFVVLR